MEKTTQKDLKKSESLKILVEAFSDNSDASMRIGIGIESENASNQTKERRLKAPLTIEEKALLKTEYQFK